MGEVALGRGQRVGSSTAIAVADGLGIEHGVNLDAVAAAGRDICAALGREPASKVAQAMKAKGTT